MLSGRGRQSRRCGREQAIGVAAVEQTRRTFEAAAAKLQDGVRDRAVAHGGPQFAPATSMPPHTQQPGVQHGQGRTPL
ncbi:hypothetical protein OG609_38770 [Streptomyces sp. NBC_01224]|uniref:hypothetical protein n=1 Tax=Streptomyces sp. NBC_01224 TaxID=2903783 RepID=UPI002E0D4460|nr:hypothetical protein OG609_38770 [Streptomyces sp. NBC_01224]